MMRLANTAAAAISVLGAFWIGSASHVRAQEYPARNVTMVVNTAPGGAVDFLGRLYSPDVPTLRSLGVDVEWLSRFVLAAPAGTPREIVAKLQADAVEIMQQPDTQARVRATVLDPETRSPRDSTAVFIATTRLVAEMAREFNIKQED